MERRKCRRCGYPMTRIITQTIEPGGSRWKACYTCLSCGHKIVAAPAGSRAEAEKGLEDFAAMIDQEYKTADTRSAAPTKPRPAEADRALKAYGLYCQLCETLTGKPIAKMDELLTAAKKARRELCMEGREMSELIERKEAIEAIKKYGKDALSAGRKHIDQVDDIVELCNMLAALPAVDAAPVVHGEWIGESDGYADGELVYDVWNCSKCDYCIDDGTDNPELLPNYCPNCGAKMDGEGDAE